MTVNEQFPTLVPTLYPGSIATDPKSCASLDKMWKAFSDFAHNKTPAVSGDWFPSLPVSSSGVRSSAPSAPRPAGHGRSQGRAPSQTPSWQTASSNNPIVMTINDPTDPWIDQTSNCWLLEEHHYVEVFAVSTSFKTADPPLWSGLLSPSARAVTLRENRGHVLNCHEETHSFRNCRHPCINASGCLNPKLGQVGDDDAYRRWQASMTSYSRDRKSSHAHNHKINRRHRSGQSRGCHQDQGHVNSNSGNPGNPYTSGHHGVPPSPASSAPAADPECILGLPITRAKTQTRASQVPFAPANDSSTAVRQTRLVRRQHCRGILRLCRKMLVYLLPACPITQHKLPLLRAKGLLRRMS